MGAANGYSAKETLLIEPGILFDIWELYLRANGYKRHNDDEGDD